MAAFIWTAKNTDHLWDEHKVTPAEAEYVVAHAAPPYPTLVEGMKFLVRGQTQDGRYLQVIYVLEEDAEHIDWDEVDLVELEVAEGDVFYIIHARDLTTRETKALRKIFKRRGQ